VKDYDLAGRYLEEARQLLPNNPRVFDSLASLVRHQNQWDRSDSFYSQAERLDPRNVGLLLQRALHYIGLRRLADALQKLDRLLEIEPDDPYAPALKAGIAQMQGDLPRAAMLLAPLHPEVNQTQIFELQIYQAILERRPAESSRNLSKY
jgi:tetratricopeptide (TPR) repeat protein